MCTKKKPTKVTYIANMGFMIDTQNNKILIDALFGEKELGYCDTPDSNIIQEMIEGKGTFKDIDLVLATHNHQDHFHAPYVQQFLENNPKAGFISSFQATNKLSQNKQIISLTPKKLSKLETLQKDIKITFFRLPHSSNMISDELSGEKYNKHEKVENVGILIETDGVKIFHSGDSYAGLPDEFEKYKLQNEGIDIAILDRIYLFNENGQKVVKDQINPKHLIIGHINPRRKEMFKKFANKLSADYFSVKVFENKMDVEVYSF